ncbi:MAG: hypothetical protein H7839_07605 [Magnetococcus sp. YQC-5]
MPESNACHTGLHSVFGQVVFNRLLPGGHGLLRLFVGELAGKVGPGQFVHLTCDDSLTLPRPFSLMDANPHQGTVDLFYRIVGRGTELMAAWKEGIQVKLLMPLGHPFVWPDLHTHFLLLAGGAGLAPIHFLARRLVRTGVNMTLLWGIETESPLETIVKQDDQSLALAELDGLGIVSRLASLTPRAGRFQGYVTDLAVEILASLDEERRSNTLLYACGPHPMLVAVHRLATRFGLKGQVSLEERMACGFGGCAACVAPIRTQDGAWSYQKICTDGPVFSLSDVVWEQYGA